MEVLGVDKIILSQSLYFYNYYRGQKFLKIPIIKNNIKVFVYLSILIGLVLAYYVY